MGIIILQFWKNTKLEALCENSCLSIYIKIFLKWDVLFIIYVFFFLLKCLVCQYGNTVGVYINFIIEGRQSPHKKYTYTLYKRVLKY